jgi:uncharacterized protein (TIGR02444 family)
MDEKHVSLSLTIEHLWQFSLQYYGVKDVKEACLSLQNHFGGNVNVVLLLKWLDDQHVSINKLDFERLVNSTATTDKLLNRYRELRKALKIHLPDPLYREALQFELQLEKQQQADLINCVNQSQFFPATNCSLTQQYCQSLNASHLSDIFSKNHPKE